eukprot:COSAG06_NODE_32237_length_509_cov_0.919512_1_plen_96_part_10
MSAVGGGVDDRIARSKAILEKHRNTKRSSSRAAPSPAADVPLATPPRASTAVAAAGGWPMGAADPNVREVRHPCLCSDKPTTFGARLDASPTSPTS